MSWLCHGILRGTEGGFRKGGDILLAILAKNCINSIEVYYIVFMII